MTSPSTSPSVPPSPSTSEDFTTTQTNKEGNQMTQIKLNSRQIEETRKAANGILRGFDWGSTPEGMEFWTDVHKKLEGKADHGTTDGKSFTEKELNDEDAKRRPWVKVKSDSRDEWGSFLVRLIYVRPKGVEYMFVVEDPEELHDVTAWSCCRLATPEEIEAANADRR
jgi:hypothetical protein